MTTSAPVRYGVDLITFFDPAAWGLDSREALQSAADDDPRWFWNGVLDRLVESGVSVLECTFPPADIGTAARAYGSVAAFRAELDRRGLSVVSAYFADLEHADLSREHIADELEAAADAAATLVEEAGGSFLVMGLPMRTTSDRGGLAPVDLALATTIASLVHRVAAATDAHGVKSLLHPESHSTFWTSRDVDLMMLLTDPFLVGLCPDTGHLVLGGADPVAVIARHADRIGLLHWKDAAGPFLERVPVDAEVFVRHRDYFRPLGDGIVDWAGIARVLAARDIDGPVLLELDATPDPVGRLVDARRHLDAVFAATA